jgi:hypothetical protein
MRKLTLWESICRLAGKDGMAAVSIAKATEGSAVPQNVAEVEIRQFLDNGLIVDAGDGMVRLSEAGRTSCGQIHHTPTSVTNVTADMSEPEVPQR